MPEAYSGSVVFREFLEPNMGAKPAALERENNYKWTNSLIRPGTDHHSNSINHGFLFQAGFSEKIANLYSSVNVLDTSIPPEVTVTLIVLFKI